MTHVEPSYNSESVTDSLNAPLPIVSSFNAKYTIVVSDKIPDILLPSSFGKHYRADETAKIYDNDDDDFGDEEEEKADTRTVNITEPNRTNQFFNFLNTVSFLSENKSIPHGSIIFCNITTLPRPQLIFADRLRWLLFIHENYPANCFHVIEREGKPLKISCGSTNTNARRRSGRYKELPTIADALPFFYASINDKKTPLEIIVDGKDYRKTVKTTKNYYRNNLLITKPNTYYMKYYFEGFMHSDDYVFTSAPASPIATPHRVSVASDELSLRLPKINSFMKTNFFVSDTAAGALPNYQLPDKTITEFLRTFSQFIPRS